MRKCVLCQQLHIFFSCVHAGSVYILMRSFIILVEINPRIVQSYAEHDSQINRDSGALEYLFNARQFRRIVAETRGQGKLFTLDIIHVETN